MRAALDRLLAALVLAVVACTGAPSRSAPAPALAPRVPRTAAVDGPMAASNAPAPLDASSQLVVVTTTSWDTIGGTLRRYSRPSPSFGWRLDGAPVPIVVGRTGLAWGDDRQGLGTTAPRKHEGDGRAPAGLFPLDTAFGFASAEASRWVRMPYHPLRVTTECVDDTASRHYNTVVDRDAVPRVDWTSAEHMRQIAQYRLGVIVGYNAAPTRAGRGSCIFLHIWGGPSSPTAGCTAMPERDLTALVMWLDRARRPMLAQLPEAEYARLRSAWGLP